MPSKGTGAVDHSRLAKLTASDTSRLHEFVDVVGAVSTRRASCQKCDACWNGAQENYEYKYYTGQTYELSTHREEVPARAAQRVDRATINQDSVARAERAVVGSVICVETHEDEQSFPWVIGSVVTPISDAPIASAPHNKDPIQFEALRLNEPALQVRLYEALQPGSSTHTLSELVMGSCKACSRNRKSCRRIASLASMLLGSALRSRRLHS